MSNQNEDWEVQHAHEVYGEDKRQPYWDNDMTRRAMTFIRQWKSKSKYKGDFYWRKAQDWTGLGDYIPGYDDGEPIKR